MLCIYLYIYICMCILNITLSSDHMLNSVFKLYKWYMMIIRTIPFCDYTVGYLTTIIIMYTIKYDSRLLYTIWYIPLYIYYNIIYHDIMINRIIKIPRYIPHMIHPSSILLATAYFPIFWRPRPEKRRRSEPRGLCSSDKGTSGRERRLLDSWRSCENCIVPTCIIAIYV